MTLRRRSEMGAKDALPGLEPGQRYKVHMLIPGVWNVMREAIMDFLSYGDSTHPNSLFFSLRPLAGTQEVDYNHIHAMWKTEADLKVPTKVPTEERVY